MVDLYLKGTEKKFITVAFFKMKMKRYNDLLKGG